jgi:uncharacterized protein YjbJ (UPF0337 family)
MNWDRNWKQLTGNVKRQFGKLIDGKLDLWEGKRDPDRDAEHRWENEGGNPPLTEPPDAKPRKHL